MDISPSDLEVLEPEVQEALRNTFLRGQCEQFLELAAVLLERWPRERIRNTNEWRILAMLSHMGCEGRLLGFTAAEISRKVALTARLSYYQTRNDFDVVYRTIALSSIEEIPIEHALHSLAQQGHLGHYASARLGHAAYVQGNMELIKLCIRRSMDTEGVPEDMVCLPLETLILKSYLAIMQHKDIPESDIVQLWKELSPGMRERYYNTLTQFLDPEDLY